MLIYYNAGNLTEIISICWNPNIQRKEVPVESLSLKPFEGKEDWHVRKVILEVAHSHLLEHERENALMMKEQCFILKQRQITNAYCVLEHPKDHNKMEKCAVELETKDILIFEKDLINGQIALTPEEIEKMMQYWLPLESKGGKNELIHIDYFIDPEPISMIQPSRIGLRKDSVGNLQEVGYTPEPIMAKFVLLREIYTGEEPMKREILLAPSKIEEDIQFEIIKDGTKVE